MKSDVISITRAESSLGDALHQAAAVAAYKGLSGRDALQLRLLTEEMVGMMRSITGSSEGQFWMEDEGGVYQLHLRVETRMSLRKRDQLMAAATTGRNEAARGLMGRLRDLFDRDADSDVAPYTSPLLTAGLFDQTTISALDLEWSMNHARDALEVARLRDEEQAAEAWDELEKSVVAHVADKVKVFIRGDVAEMVIYKKLG